MVDGPSARAARMSARLVMDLEPGMWTVASMERDPSLWLDAAGATGAGQSCEAVMPSILPNVLRGCWYGVEFGLWNG